jgi:hypothetical protein
MENNVLKWYGELEWMEYGRWPKQIMTWSVGGRRRQGRPKVKWEKEVERVMWQGNLTSSDTVNHQIWRLERVTCEPLEN